MTFLKDFSSVNLVKKVSQNTVSKRHFGKNISVNLRILREIFTISPPENPVLEIFPFRILIARVSWLPLFSNKKKRCLNDEIPCLCVGVWIFYETYAFLSFGPLRVNFAIFAREIPRNSDMKCIPIFDLTHLIGPGH